MRRAGLSLVLLAAACGGVEGDLSGLDPADGLDEIEAEAEEWLTETLATPTDSPHPYTDNLRFERRVDAPAGALSVKLRMRVRTETNYDFVEIRDGNGALIQKLTGAVDTYTREVPGRSVRVLLTSDGSVTDWGFSVSGYQYKRTVTTTPPPPPPSNGTWQAVTVTNIATAHPYGNNADQSWNLEGPTGATKLRVHFSNFDTEAGYDFARILDASGAEAAKLSGKLNTFVSAEISGGRAILRFTSDGSVTARGFDVPRFEAFVPSGSQPPPPPPPPSGTAQLADACDARTAPCAPGLQCLPEQNSAAGGVCAQAGWSREALAFPVATAHPYPDNANQSLEVSGPSWATRVKLVFDGFDLESGYDFATVTAGGAQVGRYTGKQATLVSAECTGSSATVRLTSDTSVTGYGFEVRSVDAFGVPSELVAISLDPRQCASDRVPTDDAGLRTYLESQGVAVYGIRRYRFSASTCTACTCPTGERIVLVVAAEDAAAVNNLSRYTGVFSVAGGDNVFSGRLVKMGTTPKQCNSNAWDQYCASRSCGASLAAKVKAWAGSVGVTPYAVFTKPVRQVVCSACSCPTGHDVLVAVPEAQQATMMSQGFSVVP